MTSIEKIRNALLAPRGSRPRVMAHGVVGYPDRETSMRIFMAIAQSGAHMIEAQLPFSDPSADGPAIVEANHRALALSATTRDCLEMLAQLRKHSDKPILVMSYLNPILAYGPEELVAFMAAHGLDGLIVPDLPEDEASPPLRELCHNAGLAFVPLIAPQTSIERAQYLCALAESPFLYAVIRLGVTGRASTITAAMLGRLSALGKATGCAVAAGFGIREAAQIELLTSHAECAIVGSALIDAIRGALKSGASASDAVTAKLSELIL